MASLQEKEERAEAAAKVAAAELSDLNGERRSRPYEEEAELRESPRSYSHQEERPGVIGSIVKSVKEAVTGKSQETSESTRETAEQEAEKAREAKERAAEKAEETEERAKETAESAVEKAKQVKDSAAGKAGEYKYYAAEEARETKESVKGKAKEFKAYSAQKAEEAPEKAKETKDSAAQEGEGHGGWKITELKDSTVDSARRAMDFLTGKKEEVKQKAGDTEAGERYSKEETRRGVDGLKQKNKDYEREGDRRRGADVVLVEVEETPAGEVTPMLKTADQLTGQTLNDVGRLDDEGRGAVRVERKDTDRRPRE